ncbi:Uncharacterized protein FWK35_00004302 [Aphis craccivora]|uniref:ATP-dependent DNA helicase n=1 Tax=Aphis craccivora TaxID=307492 RepID=A0A6G0ZQK8_APHCR|nr:Uncharacterized protein FWK35_00004302 [Aphis craccivora]
MDRRKFKVIRGARAYLKIMENDGQIWQQQRYYCYTTTKKNPLAVASSGIVATLLECDRTAHTTFKISLTYDDTLCVCYNISKQSNTAQLMLELRGTKDDEVNALLKRYYIWPDITKFKLKTNMNILSSDQKNKTFSDALLCVGNDTEEAMHYPTEFLNSLSPSVTLPNKLILKIDSPMIILRNLSSPKLWNAGEVVLVPRIPMIPTNLPFQLRQLQFPVKLSFAMTINKAHGQPLNFAGLGLTFSVFPMVNCT